MLIPIQYESVNIYYDTEDEVYFAIVEISGKTYNLNEDKKVDK